MGTGRGRSGCFSLWREGLGGLGHCFDGGGVLCIFRFLSLKRSLPCAPHPPASLGLRLSRNFLDKVSKKPQDPPPPPPPPSQNMRKGLNGKLGARARAPVCLCVCVCLRATVQVVCARARARRDGRGDSHNEGNKLFSPPPTSLRCASALGQLPWPLRSGGRAKALESLLRASARSSSFTSPSFPRCLQ